MVLKKNFWVVFIVLLLGVLANLQTMEGGPRPQPRRILLDTDFDTDDFFALLYLLKLNRSEFELEVIQYVFLLVVFVVFCNWLLQI